MHETVSRPATFHVEELDRISVVEVTGDVDMANAADLLATLTTTLDSCPAGMVVDLTRTTFFCSAGINLLVTAATRARERSLPMVVLADHSAVLRPLQLAGVSGLLTIRPTRELALAAVPRLT